MKCLDVRVVLLAHTVELSYLFLLDLNDAAAVFVLTSKVMATRSKVNLLNEDW